MKLIHIVLIHLVSIGVIQYINLYKIKKLNIEINKLQKYIY